MRTILIAAFVIACAAVFVIWRDGRSISYEIVLALPLIATAILDRPRTSGVSSRRWMILACLGVVLIANVALVALGTIPWYAGLLATPLLVLGWRAHQETTRSHR